jgi:hypothetical protein
MKASDWVVNETFWEGVMQQQQQQRQQFNSVEFNLI